MSVKITCDVAKNVLFGKALMWPLWKKRLILKEENKREKVKRRGVEE